jgi:hypothetical protein
VQAEEPWGGRFHPSGPSAPLEEHGKRILLAREKATLPEDLVLYCGRHDYGTRVLSNTGEPRSGHGRRWGTGM